MPKIKLLQPLRVNRSVSPEKVEELLGTEKTLRWLAQQYPVAFPQNTRDLHPIGIDIRDQLLEAIGTDANAPDAGIVFRALGMWTKSGPYVTAAAKGRVRLNLDGTISSPISDAHRAYAQRVLDERKVRRKPATAPKLRPVPIAPSRSPTRPTLNLRRPAWPRQQ